MKSLLSLILATTVITNSRACNTYDVVSCKQAEQYLHELALVADTEDAWVCSGTKLYDVGEEIKGQKRMIDVVITKKIDQSLSILYHIHPLKIQDGLGPAPPSSSDLRSHHNRKKQFPGLVEKVLDGSGVWTYTTNEEFDKVFSDDPFASIFEVYDNFIEPRNEILTRKPLQDSDIDEYIARMRNIGVVLKYERMQ
jgi:hypothetical protein